MLAGRKSSLSSLVDDFNAICSDPKTEVRVMKAILIREGLVTQLKHMTQRLVKQDHVALLDGNALLHLLLQTREASVHVLYAIAAWQSVRCFFPICFLDSYDDRIHPSLWLISGLAKITWKKCSMISIFSLKMSF